MTYYVHEDKVYAEFADKKEALTEADNQSLFFPENNYYVTDESGQKLIDKTMEKIDIPQN